MRNQAMLSILFSIMHVTHTHTNTNINFNTKVKMYRKEKVIVCLNIEIFFNRNLKINKMKSVKQDWNSEQDGYISMDSIESASAFTVNTKKIWNYMTNQVNPNYNLKNDFSRTSSDQHAIPSSRMWIGCNANLNYHVCECN